MPGKKVQCSYCSKVMRSDNLKYHVKKHERKRHMKTHSFTINSKEREIPSFDGLEFGTEKPKSKETIDKLRKLVKNNTVVVSPPPLKKVRMNTSLSFDDDDDDDDVVIPNSKAKSQNVKSVLPTAVLKECMKPKSIGELWCNEGNNVSTDVSEEDSDENIDDDNEKSLSKHVKVLPNTVEGLETLFHKLFREFTQLGKVENRNELVFLLDVMVRRELITPSEYEQLNNILANSLVDDKDDEKEDLEYIDEEIKNDEKKEVKVEQDEFKRLIQSTDDDKELQDLLQEIENSVDPEFIESVIELRRLIVKFLRNEFDPDDGELILPKIMTICRVLEASSIALTKQQRIKMLLNNISENRYRIESILTRLDQAEDEEDISNILVQLIREELISQEQLEKLKENNVAFELPTVVKIIRNTKIGRGIKFHPRQLSDLTSKLESLIEKGSVPIKDILVYLDEIFRKKGITSKEYQDITTLIDNVKN